MPRPLINRKTTAAGLPAQVTRAARAPGGRIRTDRRSDRYVKALRALDSGGHLATADVAGIVDDVHREFSEQFCSEPLGIIGKCYLGEQFEVHTLALDGSIIEHYRAGQSLPGGMERARTLAESPLYLAVEVYADRVVCIRADGSAVLLESES